MTSSKWTRRSLLREDRKKWHGNNYKNKEILLSPTEPASTAILLYYHYVIVSTVLLFLKSFRCSFEAFTSPLRLKIYGLTNFRAKFKIEPGHATYFEFCAKICEPINLESQRAGFYYTQYGL